jgi:hypothetical protein
MEVPSSFRRDLDVGEADSVLRTVLPTASSDDAPTRIAVVVHSEKRQRLADHVNIQREVERVADALRECAQLAFRAVREA